ncbi:hypothetical protein Tco_1207527, partial [Tanacetum coccineum]
ESLPSGPDVYAIAASSVPGDGSRTDISEITRKSSKTCKHGLENGRVYKSRKQSHEKVNLSQAVKGKSNYGQQKSTIKRQNP